MITSALFKHLKYIPLLSPLCLSLYPALSHGDCVPQDNVSAIPTKVIKIYNNTRSTIYPVIETSTNSTDEWLQAEFKICKSEMGTKKFPHTQLYRVFVNWPQGLGSGNFIALNVPFYSTLYANSNPVEPDQYIDWWNGGRLKIYDSTLTLTEAYNSGKSPIMPQTLGLSCASVPGSECDQLTIFADTAALTDESPSQLTEYTFGGAIRATDPYTMAYQDVDYDISYVDHLHLPIAMSPLGNRYIGYSGTVKTNQQFSLILNNFLATTGIGFGWPTFIIPGNKDKNIIKIPGAYNAIQGIVGQTITKQGKAITKMFGLWANCIPFYRPLTGLKEACPKDMQPALNHVHNFFMQNYIQYKNDPTCDPAHRVALKPMVMLAQIYGWVPFNQYCQKGAAANSLCKTSHDRTDPAINNPDPTVCTVEYYQLHQAYRKLEYSYKEYRTGQQYNFNPYVELIHGSNYMAMDAYAFSIDDAVGNMQELGTGLIIAVGGPKGLVNNIPFNPRRAIMVNLGDPNALNRPEWLGYGACDLGTVNCKPDMTLLPHTTSFKLGTIKKFPTQVIITDALQRQYKFEISGLSKDNTLPPNAVNKATCTAPDNSWCEGVYVHISTDENGHKVNNIQGPPPPVAK